MIAWNRASAAHLLRRAGFGAGRERLESALADGLETTVERLLAQREHDERLVRGVRSVLALEDVDGLAAWWMALVLRDRAPLVERMALMWHDHFATSNDKVRDVRLMHGQVQLFRERGLGDFRALLHAVARDPAMLVWLDGNSNEKGHPNENFAREVLELFALGIGNYDERDIQEAARAFSGWGVEGRRFVIRPHRHDDGEKELFGRRGRLDGEGAIDAILEHPACARHVARRLLEEMMHPAPTAAEITEWAAVLVAEEWSVERTLARLLRSELFFSPRARRSRIAGPVELVARLAIELELSVVPARAAKAVQEMGQSLFRPPSVEGWKGGRTWIHSGSWLARHNHLTAAASDPAQTERIAAALGDPDDPHAVAASLAERLLPDGAEPRLVALLERAASEPEDAEEGLRRATALALTAPEVHLV